MFFEPAKGHGLPHSPYNAIIAPRPIGWVATCDEKGGFNLAPYSYFNLISANPPIVIFSSVGLKDSAKNAIDTGEFTLSLSTRVLAEKMNATSAAVRAGVNEFEIAGLEMAPSRLIRTPYVAGCPAAFECRVSQHVNALGPDGKPAGQWVVFGNIIGCHIDERFIDKDGRFDMVAAQTIARCGYHDYTEVTNLFEMKRPGVAPGMGR